MRLPRIRLSIRAMMAVVLLAALVAGAAVEVVRWRRLARQYQTKAVHYQRLEWVSRITIGSLEQGVKKLEASLSPSLAGWKPTIDTGLAPPPGSSLDFSQLLLIDLEARVASEREKAGRYGRLADAYAEAARRPWLGPPEGEKDTPE